MAAPGLWLHVILKLPRGAMHQRTVHPVPRGIEWEDADGRIRLAKILTANDLLRSPDMRLPPTRTSRFFLPLTFSVLWVASTSAQEVVVIPDEISCPECQIEVDMMFELGGPGDTLNIVHANFLPIDSRGRAYYQSVYVPGLIQVFDREGKHIHAFGGEGEGPGEFRGWAALFVSPGDSLYAFDSGLYRLSVFSPEYEFVRSARIDPPLRPLSGFFQDDGSLLRARSRISL